MLSGTRAGEVCVCVCVCVCVGSSFFLEKGKMGCLRCCCVVCHLLSTSVRILLEVCACVWNFNQDTIGPGKQKWHLRQMKCPVFRDVLSRSLLHTLSYIHVTRFVLQVCHASFFVPKTKGVRQQPYCSLV